MGSKVLIYILRALLIALAIAGAGAFMALRKQTFVSPEIVVTISLVLSSALSWLIARKDKTVVAIKNFPLRLAVWTILIASIFTGIFYTVNYCGADEGNQDMVAAVVVRKYYETRQRTRRVRKGRYVATGETYRVHYADIRLADGHLITVPLSGDKVCKVRNGQKLDVAVASGAFGIPVAISRNIFGE